VFTGILDGYNTVPDDWNMSTMNKHPSFSLGCLLSLTDIAILCARALFRARNKSKGEFTYWHFDNHIIYMGEQVETVHVFNYSQVEVIWNFWGAVRVVGKFIQSADFVSVRN